MPHVNISGDHTSSLDKHNYELDPGHHVFKSPLVVKESAIAGKESHDLVSCERMWTSFKLTYCCFPHVEVAFDLTSR